MIQTVAYFATDIIDMCENNGLCYIIDHGEDFSKPVRTTVCPRLFAQYLKATELVGIYKTIDEVIKIIMEGYEVSKQRGKIVSIVGSVGLGKTTLANAVYEKLREKFDCWAFVSVAQNPDMKQLFKGMLYQLGKKTSSSNHQEVLDERLLIYELIEFLHNKRSKCIKVQLMHTYFQMYTHRFTNTSPQIHASNLHTNQEGTKFHKRFMRNSYT